MTTIEELPVDFYGRFLAYVELSTTMAFLRACSKKMLVRLRRYKSIQTVTYMAPIPASDHRRVIGFFGTEARYDPPFTPITRSEGARDLDWKFMLEPAFSKLSSLSLFSPPNLHLTFPVDSMPSSLTHLCWHAAGNPFYQEPTEIQTVRSALPNLRYLEFEPGDCPIGPIGQFLDQLPLGLQFLSHPMNQNSFEGFEKLPPGLTTLSLFGAYKRLGWSYMVKKEDFQILFPASLTDLRLSTFAFNLEGSSAEVSWFRHLECLKRLRIHQFKFKKEALLALRNLEVLEVIEMRDKYSLDLIAVGLPVLRKLVVPGFSYPTVFPKLADLTWASYHYPFWADFRFDAISISTLTRLNIPAATIPEYELTFVPAHVSSITMLDIEFSGNSLPGNLKVIDSMETFRFFFSRKYRPFHLSILKEDWGTKICAQANFHGEMNREILPDIDVGPCFPVKLRGEPLNSKFMALELETFTAPGHGLTLDQLPATVTRASNVIGIGPLTEFNPNLVHLSFLQSSTVCIPSKMLEGSNIRTLENATIELDISDIWPSPSEAHFTGSWCMGTEKLPNWKVLSLKFDRTNIPFLIRQKHLELINSPLSPKFLLKTLQDTNQSLPMSFEIIIDDPTIIIPPRFSGFPANLRKLDLRRSELRTKPNPHLILPAGLEEILLDGAAAQSVLHGLGDSDEWIPSNLKRLTLETRCKGGYISLPYQIPFLRSLNYLHIISNYISAAQAKSVPRHLDVVQMSGDEMDLVATSSGRMKPMIAPEARDETKKSQFVPSTSYCSIS